MSDKFDSIEFSKKLAQLERTMDMLQNDMNKLASDVRYLHFHMDRLIADVQMRKMELVQLPVRGEVN
jgi:uncharacterized protein YoxC